MFQAGCWTNLLVTTFMYSMVLMHVIVKRLVLRALCCHDKMHSYDASHIESYLSCSFIYLGLVGRRTLYVLLLSSCGDLSDRTIMRCPTRLARPLLPLLLLLY